MNQKNRKSTPDCSVSWISSVDRTEPSGLKRSNSSSSSSKKLLNGNQNPEHEDVEGELRNNSFSSRMSLREPTVTEDYLHRSDGFVQSYTFLKYNKIFHKQFPEVPERDNLTHTFTCSLQREVLYHGKLFVSERHVCFYSSVLLKETKVVIPFSSVKEIKKYNSALSMLFIQTSSGEKYSFASLRNYKFCYKLLQRVCSQVKEEGGNSSSHLLAENEPERDTVSTCSSVESTVDQDSSSLELDSGFPLTAGVPSTHSRTHQSSWTNEDRGAVSLIWWFTKEAVQFLFRGATNFSMLFTIYVILFLLLLLASGYIGLRITALEEQLSSLGALVDLSSHYKEYQET